MKRYRYIVICTPLEDHIYPINTFAEIEDAEMALDYYNLKSEWIYTLPISADTEPAEEDFADAVRTNRKLRANG